MVEVGALQHIDAFNTASAEWFLVHKDYLSSFAGFSTMAEFMGWRAAKAVGQELARLIRPE
jgi:hypothetical protein